VIRKVSQIEASSSSHRIAYFNKDHLETAHTESNCPEVEFVFLKERRQNFRRFFFLFTQRTWIFFLFTQSTLTFFAALQLGRSNNQAEAGKEFSRKRTVLCLE
jgi:hypothetical protein